MIGRKKLPTHEVADRLIAEGYPLVVGIDEVGRGSLAGPVVAAAVILEPGIKLPGVRDSKLLTAKQRRRLAPLIRRRARAIGVGWASHQEVDSHGLTWAVKMSGRRALTDLNHPYDAVILDGNHNYLSEECRSEAVIKGDMICLQVAAASIVAKVARDHYMMLQHQLYPKFGFNRNVGYATRFHLEAIKANVSPIHRQSFSPVAQPALFLEWLKLGAVEIADVD